MMRRVTRYLAAGLLGASLIVPIASTEANAGGGVSWNTPGTRDSSDHANNSVSVTINADLTMQINVHQSSNYPDEDYNTSVTLLALNLDGSYCDQPPIRGAMGIYWTNMFYANDARSQGGIVVTKPAPIPSNESYATGCTNNRIGGVKVLTGDGGYNNIIDSGNISVGSAPCPNIFFTAAASYTAVNTTFAVRVTNTSTNDQDKPDHYVVKQIDDTLLVTLNSLNTTAAYPNVYYGTNSAIPAPGPSEYIVESRDANNQTLCTLHVTNVSSTPIDPTGDTGGTDNNPPPGGGTSCGFSLNPLNYLKCLFWPTSGVQSGWTSRINDLKTRPPINIADTVYSFIGTTIGTASQCPSDPVNWASICGGVNQTVPTHTWFGDPSTGISFDPLWAASKQTTGTPEGKAVYDVIVIGLWVGFAFLVWGRISSSFGGKGSDE